MRSLVLILKKAIAPLASPCQWNALVEKWNGSFFYYLKALLKKKKKEENARTVCMTFCDRMPVTAKIFVIHLIVFVTVRES